MLIAAYAGCGKSTAARKLGMLDLPSMPYRWLLPYLKPDSHSQAEFEQEKGALHHIADPVFPKTIFWISYSWRDLGTPWCFPRSSR